MFMLQDVCCSNIDFCSFIRWMPTKPALSDGVLSFQFSSCNAKLLLWYCYGKALSSTKDHYENIRIQYDDMIIWPSLLHSSCLWVNVFPLMDGCWCSVRLPLRLDMFPSIRLFSKVNPTRNFRSWLGILPTSCDQQVPCLGRAIWMWLMVREPKTSRLHFLEIWKKCWEEI